MRPSFTGISTIPLGALLLSPLSLALPTSSPDDSAVYPRGGPAIHRQTCSGDYGGNSIGVLVCCDIDFTSSTEMTLKLSVRDSKGDSHPVYGWCVVTDENGTTYQVPSSKLRNSQGVGSTVYQSGIKFSRPLNQRIRYVSARGCVDDAGSDTCASYKGRETINPY